MNEWRVFSSLFLQRWHAISMISQTQIESFDVGNAKCHRFWCHVCKQCWHSASQSLRTAALLVVHFWQSTLQSFARNPTRISRLLIWQPKNWVQIMSCISWIRRNDHHHFLASWIVMNTSLKQEPAKPCKRCLCKMISTMINTQLFSFGGNHAHGSKRFGRLHVLWTRKIRKRNDLALQQVSHWSLFWLWHKMVRTR